MGRTRSVKTAWLPKYVRIHKGRYVYTPYLGVIFGKIQWGKEIVLGKEGDPKSTIWQQYDKHQNTASEFTIKWLLDSFSASPDYEALSRKTKKEYQKFHAIIVAKATPSGIFGNAELDKVTPPVIRQYLDKRKAEGAPISGNKEVGYLSSAWSWMYQRREGMSINPCKGVERNQKQHVNIGDHYVSDKDYFHAINLPGPWYIPVMMEIMMICRMRKIEVLALQASDIVEAGLVTARTKGSKTNITKWTPRLRAAIDTALKQEKRIRPINEKARYLISDEYSKPIPESTVDTAWQRRMRKQSEAGHNKFKMHWLKKKGVSDFKGDKLKASGHVDPAMLKIYDHKMDEVDGTF
jgi:integrase